MVAGFVRPTRADPILYAAPSAPNGRWNLYEVVTPASTWWLMRTQASSHLTAITGVETRGHLAFIGSAAENEIVRQLAAGVDVWLGLTDADALFYPSITEAGKNRNGGWGWFGPFAPSVESYAYQNWAAGEPDGAPNPQGPNDQDAVGLNATDGTWYDANNGDQNDHTPAPAVILPGIIEYDVRTMLVIPLEGFYHFGFQGDDGASLRIVGQNWLSVVDNATGSGAVSGDTMHCDCLSANNRTVGRIHLNAGNYDMELLYFERGGNAGIEVFGRFEGQPLVLLRRLGGVLLPDSEVLPLLDEATRDS